MKKITDIAAFIFILAVMVLTVVSVLGVWEVFGGDVIGKSFQTIILLAIFTLVVIGGGKFADKPSDVPVVGGNELQPVFKVIRHFTIGILAISASLLALIGVLAIWEVLVGDGVGKSLASIAIIAFSAFVIIAACLDRENNAIKHRSASVSGVVVGIIFLIILLFIIG